MKTFKRKKNRLNINNYSSANLYSITICTNDKQLFLTDKRFTEYLIVILKKLTVRFDILVWAYCFMPDHVHLLLQPNASYCMINFLKIYKQKTGFVFSKFHQKKLWQKSFYDHIVRKEEHLAEIILYILHNPLRKGLVEDIDKYPFNGSFVIDSKSLINDHKADLNDGNLKVSATSSISDD